METLHYSTPDYWHYIADEGYFFRKGDIITKEVFLSKFDHIERWDVITEAEKLIIEKNPLS
jgi:hypothetical protein